MARANKVILIAGTRGTGKTDFEKNIIFDQRKIFPKSLIVDTFDSDVWQTLETHDHPERMNIQIPIIAPEQLKNWKNGIARVFSSDTSTIMSEIQKTSRNMFIVFEDATKYIGSKLSEDVKRFVLDSKQKNIDLIFCFHSLSSIPPELVRTSDILVLFKTNEGKPSEKKYPWGEIPQMMKRLKESKNRFVHEILLLN